jgi:hypothetical protein
VAHDKDFWTYLLTGNVKERNAFPEQYYIHIYSVEKLPTW